MPQCPVFSSWSWLFVGGLLDLTQEPVPQSGLDGMKNRLLLCLWALQCGLGWCSSHGGMFSKTSQSQLLGQKCSFELHRLGLHRGAVVLAAVPKIGPIRNGLHASQASTQPSQPFTATAFTNDRLLDPTGHLYWKVWQGHTLCPLKREPHTASLCASVRLLREWSLHFQRLTPAFCFLFHGSTLGASCPWPSQTHPTRHIQPELLSCCCRVLRRSVRPSMTRLLTKRTGWNVWNKTWTGLFAAPQREPGPKPRRR